MADNIVVNVTEAVDTVELNVVQNNQVNISVQTPVDSVDVNITEQPETFELNITESPDTVSIEIQTGMSAYDIWIALGNSGSYQDFIDSVGQEMAQARRTDFVTESLIYKGWAVCGASESNPVWRIQRIVIASDDDTQETWADGNSAYDNVWNNRGTYTYS